MIKANFKQALASVALFFALSPAAIAQGNDLANQLGGGFVAGMTPAQTCEMFKQNYTNRGFHNKLCRKVGQSNFSNLTVSNDEIIRSKFEGQPIKAVTFKFDENQKLAKVIAKGQTRWSIDLQID